MLSNCFYDNSAGVSGDGGAIFVQDDAILPTTVLNNTICNNSAESGGGIFRDSGDITVINCILWGNGDDLFDVTDYSFSCIEDTEDLGNGVIHDDPLFDGDCCHLMPGSPCLNGGDPNTLLQPGETDLDGELRVLHGVVDMGADEVLLPAGDHLVTIDSPPFSGVNVLVDQEDQFGRSDGLTQFTRVYAENQTVTLTAESESQGAAFDHWLLDGVMQPQGQTDLTIEEIDNDHTASVVSDQPPCMVGQWGGCSFDSIQAAIDSDWSTEIVVCPGTYVLEESLDFKGKPVTVRSTGSV